MNENDKHFIKRYEELLDKGYCDCNEMNCIDNNSPRRILNIVINLQFKIDKAIEYIENNLEEVNNFMFANVNEYDDYVVYLGKNENELLDILKEDK